MNVALVKLSALGDIVHALPVAAALRTLQPSWRLTWIVERRHARLLRDHPALDDLVVVDTRSWRSARGPAALARTVRELGALGRRLRAARYDAVVDLQGLVKSGLLARVTGARMRIGFATRECRERLNALFTNRHVTPPPSAQHVIEQYLALLSPLGATATALPVAFHLPSDPAAENAVEEFFDGARLKSRDRVVVLNPGAGRPEKRWPASRFADLARRLADEDVGRVIVAWGPGEFDIARTIADGGPTPPVRNAPWGKVHKTLHGGDGTMATIDPGSVLGAVRELVS